MTVPIWLQNTVAVEWFRTRTVQTNQSPFSGDVWQSANLDTRWVARISYAEMTRDEAGPLLAAIAAQRDGLGTFYLFDPDFAVPRSGFTGFGNIQASPAFGDVTVLCNNFPPSTLLAKAGDKCWIGYGGSPPIWRMMEVTSDIGSGPLGSAAIPIDELPMPLPTAPMSVGFHWLGGQGVPMRLIRHSRQSLPGGRFSISIEAEERL